MTIYSKQFIFLFWFSILALASQAQNNSISGKISDVSGQHVEYANVILMSLPDSSTVSSIMSDSLGNYNFKRIDKGNYILNANLFGYKSKLSEPFSLDSASVIKIHLTLEDEYLEVEEVVIERKEKPLVRQEPDKMVVNVENSVANSGLNVIDLLRKSPGISVDQDGKIELKGRRGVLVMIDDKPLYMSEEQVGNLLRSIPSDQIKEIEIITSPSAKYDAAGSSGIINIKLKKGAYEGLNGDINGSLGHGVYHKANGGANVSYRKKKISINGGYQYMNKKEMSDFYTNRNSSGGAGTFSRLNSDSYYREPRAGHTLNFSSQYQLSSKSDIALDVNNIITDYHWNGKNNSTQYDNSGRLSNTYQSSEIGVSSPYNLNTNLAYTLKPDTNGTIFSAAVNYNGFFGRESNEIIIRTYDDLNNESASPYFFSLSNNYKMSQGYGRADFTKYILKKTKLESGVKVIRTRNELPANISITENGSTRDASNHFIYDENIYAAYTTLHKELSKKWKVQVGLRIENTQTKGVQSIIDSTFTRNYTNLFPSGSISYSQTAKTSYTLLYSRRIERPNSMQLHPVLALVDPYTYYGGNPYLLPEITDKVDLAYSLFSGYLITTLSYAYSIRPITWVTRIDPTTQKSIGGAQNMKSQRSAGVSVAVNMPVTKWWSTNNYIHVFNNKFIGDLGAGETTNERMMWFFNSTQTIKLPKKTTLELSGVYEPRGVYALTTSYTRWQMNIAVGKKIWDNKATVKLALSDIFRTYRYGGSTDLGNTNVTTAFRWDNRVLMLSFSYKIGKRLLWVTGKE